MLTVINLAMVVAFLGTSLTLLAVLTFSLAGRALAGLVGAAVGVVVAWLPMAAQR